MRLCEDNQLRSKASWPSDSCIIVIDDDQDFRESLGRLVRSVGLDARLFASIDDFRRSKLPNSPTCLVLDVRLPGQSGLDFQRDLTGANARLPVVFITGHGDIPMTVQAMKAGALEFLTKPVREQDLLDAINVGLVRDQLRRESEQALDTLRARFNVLTPRERTILKRIVDGRLNKQIAGELNIAESTVKVHRSNMMRKIKAGSVPELCRMLEKLKLTGGVSDPP